MAASNHPAHTPPDADDAETDAEHSPTLLAGILAGAPGAPLRAAAFWGAVVLPFLHVPLLTTGLTAPGERHAFVALLALNAVALYVGHGHQ